MTLPTADAHLPIAANSMNLEHISVRADSIYVHRFVG